LPPSRANRNDRTRGITCDLPSASVTTVSDVRGCGSGRGLALRAASKSARGAYVMNAATVEPALNWAGGALKMAAESAAGMSCGRPV
jgi:hypothetical protein